MGVREDLLDLLEKSAYVIMEAEKAPYLPSAICRPMKAGPVIQSESEGLTTKGVEGLSPSPKAREPRNRSTGVRGQKTMGVPAQVETKLPFSPSFLLCLGPEQIG